MATWGRADFAQLKKLKDNLDRLQGIDMDRFCREASKELAARLLALVIPATPVGRYPAESGKKGGTLRRGWTGQKGAKAYAQSVPIAKSGSEYIVTIINPVEYASYVEFGHRTRSHDGWVPGQYFLTKSEEELRRIAPGLLEKKLEAYLREVFNV